jgi:DNA-binding SARP family transcriptional activator
MSTRTTASRAGLAALVKSAVLVVGVPLALARLWLLAPLPVHLVNLAATRSVSVWAHLAIIVVGMLWAVATANLAREIRGALRRGETIDSNTWSTRWAAAIAGLILLATAGTPLVASGFSRVPPVAVATARAALPIDSRPVPNHRPARQARPTVTVERDECLADVAIRTTGCVDDWPLLAHLNLGQLQTDGTRMLDPARLRAGWRLNLPAGAGSAAVGVPRPREAAPPPASSLDRRLAELALVGLGVVTTCALARRVRNLRRTGSSARHYGERRGPSARPVAETRAALEPFADAPLIDWIDLADRLLWRLVHDDDVAPPDVRLVRAGPDGVEFLLATPRPEAPWPFVPRRAGRWWRLDPAVEPEDFAPFAADSGRLVQPLLPLGDDEHASYLLVLGRGRRLGIDGPDELVDRTLGALVASLRTVPWAEQLAVELVGIDPPPPDERCYQLSSATRAVLTDLATADTLGPEPRPIDHGRPDPLVVVGRDATSPECERVLAAAGAIAGIVAPGSRGTERLAVASDHATLLPYGIELTAVTPSSGQFDLLDGLLAEARRPAMIVPIRPGLATDRARLTDVPAAGAIEVRLLSPAPVLVGPTRDVGDRDTARVIELLAFLTLHDGRVTLDAAADALFARSAPAVRRSRIDHVASAARAALGPGPDGRVLLARRGEELLLDPSVTCDAVRARRAFASAPSAEPDAAEVLLVGALGLVEGPPLGGVVAGYSWFGAESLDEACAAEIVDGAHHLASLALASGRFELARWAIGRGRLVDASSEILARDLMAVAAAEDDTDGVRGVFLELENALERIGAGEPSLETRALLETLDTTP